MPQHPSFAEEHQIRQQSNRGGWNSPVTSLPRKFLIDRDFNIHICNSIPSFSRKQICVEARIDNDTKASVIILMHCRIVFDELVYLLIKLPVRSIEAEQARETSDIKTIIQTTDYARELIWLPSFKERRLSLMAWAKTPGNVIQHK